MDIIFTKHALKRLGKREVNEENVIRTIRVPDMTRPADNGCVKFLKDINGRKIQVVAKRLEAERKWLVISVWVRGEKDKPNLIVRIVILLARLVWITLKGLARLVLK